MTDMTQGPEPLTAEEIEEIVRSMTVNSDGYVRFNVSLKDFARAIEAAVHAKWSPLLAESQAEVERLRADAQRYQWLRPRLKARYMTTMAKTERYGIAIRIGHDFFDAKTKIGSGYLNPAEFERECANLDAAIDAALQGGKT
jgi:exonuclease VII small subunit